LTPKQHHAKDTLNLEIKDLQVDIHPVTGAPSCVGSKRGFLSGPNGQGRGISKASKEAFPNTDPHRVLKAFLKEHRDLFGHGEEVLGDALKKREFVTRHNGLRTVVWEQRLDGIPVHEGLLVAHVTSKDELVNLATGFVPDPGQAALKGRRRPGRPPAVPDLTAPAAIRQAAPDLGLNVAETDIAPMDSPEGALQTGDRASSWTTRLGSDPVRARLVWLPVKDRTLKLCWELIITPAVTATARRSRGFYEQSCRLWPRKQQLRPSVRTVPLALAAK
jgi:hypothetical protein